MGRNSSGTRGGLQPGDSNYKGEVKGVESLKNIKDRKLYNDVGQAISRYHSALGVRQKNIKLADLEAGTLGVHVTSGGKSEAVYLNKNVFKSAKSKDIVSSTKKGYASGWHTKTNKPVAHTITHELGHATWNSHLSAPNAKAAGKEITKLYNKWSNDTKKKGYGKYAKTNVNEFWAETVTKAVHGNADKYTKAVKQIIKKYQL